MLCPYTISVYTYKVHVYPKGFSEDFRHRYSQVLIWGVGVMVDQNIVPHGSTMEVRYPVI